MTGKRTDLVDVSIVEDKQSALASELESEALEATLADKLWMRTILKSARQD
jgi:hypothetical protein